MQIKYLMDQVDRTRPRTGTMGDVSLAASKHWNRCLCFVTVGG